MPDTDLRINCPYCGRRYNDFAPEHPIRGPVAWEPVVAARSHRGQSGTIEVESISTEENQWR